MQALPRSAGKDGLDPLQAQLTYIMFWVDVTAKHDARSGGAIVPGQHLQQVRLFVAADPKETL